MTEPRDNPPSSLWRDGRAALSLVFRSPLTLLLLCGLTVLALLLLWHDIGLQGLAFLHSRQEPFLQVLAVLLPTAWVASLAVVLGDFQSHRSAWPRTRSGRMALSLYTILYLPILALPLVAQNTILREEPLLVEAILRTMPASYEANLFQSILGLMTSALILSGMVGVHIQLLGRLPQYQRLRELPTPENLDEDVRWYQRCQSQLSRFLTLAAIICGTSILSVSAYRDLINRTIASRAEQLPTGPVMFYGLYYTGLIAGIYLPAHKTLRDVGQALAERLVRQSLGADATWMRRMEEEQLAHTYLGLRSSALQDLQQALSVLAPLLASISSLVLDTGG